MKKARVKIERPAAVQAADMEQVVVLRKGAERGDGAQCAPGVSTAAFARRLRPRRRVGALWGDVERPLLGRL